MRQSPDFASPGNTPQQQGEGTKFAAGERAELGRVVELEFAFVEVGPDHPEFLTIDADTRAAAFAAHETAATRRARRAHGERLHAGGRGRGQRRRASSAR